ncbi:hypothetical protein [Streptomyces cyaneofuscatus]|uniref:golvesin C-terminal-like domain-containing protein n=1 Tax=Streptomyces cyaneofuscatus TaxID=66883 RepID=UPI003415137C
MLGKDYKQSGDLAWTTTSDAQGFHVLTAAEKDGYAWKTAASLSEPGFDTDAWIGNACVTGSGKRAVVVYAPRTFTNKPELMARGAFTAIVDLTTGEVTKLPLQASLSYYNPGCGVTEEVVLTQSGGENKAATRLFTLDAAAGTLAVPIETRGQVTSAVTTKDGSLVGAHGAQIVTIDTKGEKTALVHTDSVPYRLAPDADGGLVFLDKLTPTAQRSNAYRAAPGSTAVGEQLTRVKRITGDQIGQPSAKKNTASPLAEGPLTQTGLATSAGTVFLTGKTAAVPGTRLPQTVRRLTAVPKDAKVSTHGEAVLTQTAWTDGQGALLRADEPNASRPVNVKLTVMDNGKKAEFTIDPAKRTGPGAGEGRERSPALTAPKSGGARTQSSAKAAAPGAAATARVLAAGGPDEVVESERVCSVPRNDPRNQAMQPKPRQVEWAVNQAIRNKLNTHVSRPANWKNLGMPAYQPQTLFPYPASLLNGATIPAQVMLGITAQESNMWQASRSAVPGVTGNPLIGNYYGIDYYDGLPANDWDIDWAEADCGYGITQVTDHMRLAGREDGHGGAAWDYQKQRAVALDYTANIAAGLHILADKWNQTSSAGLKVNNGNSAKLENWTFALWAYNSGFYPDTGNGSPWGLGWANNPANPEWDAGRSPFMEDSAGNEEASDAAHPQDWPYQEKVLGFAAHPPAFLESPGTMVPAYRAAWWNGKEGGASIEGSAVRNRALVKPPEDTFCDKLVNSCDPEAISDDAQNELFFGPCNRDDFKCWWSKSVQWKDDCDYSCGNDFTRFPIDWAEEADGTAYPPACNPTGLPASALIVDDLPAGTPSVRPGCSNSSWVNKGKFTLDFGSGESACSVCYTRWPAKVDLHQLGAGYGGHFYFGHTRANDAKGQRLKFTGRWELDSTISEGQAEVFAHMPDHGAHTATAEYKIYTSSGVRTKIVNQKGSSNRWISLGNYRFKNVKPKVELSTITTDGTGDQDIAFDAVAFMPGNYEDFPRIKFPAENPSAPDIDVIAAQKPQDVGHPAAAAAAALPSRKGALQGSQECTSAAAESQFCATYTPLSKENKAEASGKAKAANGVRSSNLVDWCDSAAAPSGYSLTRTEGCLLGKFNIVAKNRGVPIGNAQFGVIQGIKLNSESGVFQTETSIYLMSMVNVPAASLSSFLENCWPFSGCTAGAGEWSGSTTWTPGDSHVAVHRASYQWKGSANSVAKLNLDWEAEWRFPNATDDADSAWEHESFGIRCDSQVGQYVGCVFSEAIPELPLNYKKYPAAAAYYWVMMEKLSSHPGSKKHTSPLHRLGDDAVSKTNRDKMCELAVAEWRPHADAAGESCDEYPFAASKESGGMTLTSGKYCVQTYSKEQADGSYMLHLDDNYDYPTWNEGCGRAALPASQNKAAGGALGYFTSLMKLHKNDPYYVKTGFEGCKLSEVCTIT